MVKIKTTKTYIRDLLGKLYLMNSKTLRELADAFEKRIIQLKDKPATRYLQSLIDTRYIILSRLSFVEDMEGGLNESNK